MSLLLSEALGEEAVWVETEADSIFVGSEESCRGFVFWLSPFKWLGAEFGSRKLAALVELGERLAGWEGKFIGDNAGNGLGAWLKWMKENPEASLAQALAALAVEGEPSPRPQPSRGNAPVFQPAVKVKTPSSLSPLMIAACAVLLMAVGAMAYLHKTGQASVIPLKYARKENSPPATAPQAARAAEEAISASRVNESAAKLAREREIQRTAAKAPSASHSTSAPLHHFYPPDGEKMKELNTNSPAPSPE